MVSPDMLRRYDCFAGISEATIAALSRIGEVQSWDAGERLFMGGVRPRFLYLVIEGMVDIQVEAGGSERVVVDSVGPGDLLLWSAVVEPHVTTASGVARTPVLVIGLRAGELRQLLEREHTLGFRLMQSVSRSLSERLGGAFVQLATGQGQPSGWRNGRQGAGDKTPYANSRSGGPG